MSGFQVGPHQFSPAMSKALDHTDSLVALLTLLADPVGTKKLIADLQKVAKDAREASAAAATLRATLEQQVQSANERDAELKKAAKDAETLKQQQADSALALKAREDAAIKAEADLAAAQAAWLKRRDDMVAADAGDRRTAELRQANTQAAQDERSKKLADLETILKSREDALATAEADLTRRLDHLRAATA